MTGDIMTALLTCVPPVAGGTTTFSAETVAVSAEMFALSIKAEWYPRRQLDQLLDQDYHLEQSKEAEPLELAVPVKVLVELG
jgi:hypothetical protein